MNILVTGGSGFIGSNFLNLLVPSYPQHNFINYDKLTYAANPLNTRDIEGLPNYFFIQGDIGNIDLLLQVFKKYGVDAVVHFAAESHVDRSIEGPEIFIKTNIQGTFTLLEACRKSWQRPQGKIFHHISTDEVYGSVPGEELFDEKSLYNPSSPYSASKASSDHLVRAYHRTYGIPIKITSCSNNYGPRQFPEKLIPRVIINAMEGKAIPVYGKGENIRDWIYTADHCEAVWKVLQEGEVGETYNIGGGNQIKNIDIIQKICGIMAEELKGDPEEFNQLITFVSDRPGHDFRYGLDCTKIQRELRWTPRENIESGLAKTVKWYLDSFLGRSIKTGNRRRGWT